jgi:hypothetical protein
MFMLNLLSDFVTQLDRMPGRVPVTSLTANKKSLSSRRYEPSPFAGRLSDRILHAGFVANPAATEAVMDIPGLALILEEC